MEMSSGEQRKTQFSLARKKIDAYHDLRALVIGQRDWWNRLVVGRQTQQIWTYGSQKLTLERNSQRKFVNSDATSTTMESQTLRVQFLRK
jgi:hypothetical protein